ncbi:transglutaminase family protein [Geobacter sp.]|uniref:transglutaminase-like domain-containing protein n=1 Tax=Geobacter sp. TaxID=46610 RepID=UPI002630A34D|nr:transglutaminase-like domain-containing protein [Geobacter sp.]
MAEELSPYLENSVLIDWQTPSLREVARRLSAGTDTETAAACFAFVRDEIRHSSDIDTLAMPLAASAVLAARTGLCFAKSHLLAALLRGNGIPAGFGYVRLASRESVSGFCLHGFNTVRLKEFGWIRVDARGNNARVNTIFAPPGESLAYLPRREGEYFLAENFPRPLPVVVEAYARARDLESLRAGLPDDRRARFGPM